MSESPLDAGRIAGLLTGVPPGMQAPGNGRSECIRVTCRALEGMQKEAIVSRSGADTAWRLFCDEGPYLNGTDLAPPPLAFFSAGLAGDCAAEMTGGLQGRLAITQDAFYTMEGSAIQGTMTGGALPRELAVSAGEAAVPDIGRLAGEALDRSAGEALMRNAFSGTFSITHNGERIDTGRVAGVDGEAPADPASLFGRLGPGGENAGGRPVISKVTPVEELSGTPADAGSSLRESQKRTLHLRTLLDWPEGGPGQLKVHLVKPTGSVFGFTCGGRGPAGGPSDAPMGREYLAAGIALCFMTQLGRYAHIMKKRLDAYAVVQDMRINSAAPSILGLETHVYLKSGEDHDWARQFVDMGEQTCFLHAACRSSNPSRLRSTLN